MANFPINQDHYIQLYVPDGPRPFRIMQNGDTIYEGMAYARPNTDYASINVTRLLENYVENGLPGDFGIYKATRAVISDAFQTFEITSQSGDTWETVENVGVLAWYDYEEKPGNYTELVLSDPVNGHSAAGVNYVRSRLYNGIVTNAITTAVTPEYVEGYCGRYGITYLNKWGGYDFFLFEGKYEKSESYDIYKYNKTYDNTKNGFGSSRYQSVVTPKYTLSTGWLSDEESYRFAKHVVGSNQVWLQDLEKDKVIPVVITDTSTTYKRYEGKELISYTLTVINSQEELRK